MKVHTYKKEVEEQKIWEGLYSIPRILGGYLGEKYWEIQYKEDPRNNRTSLTILFGLFKPLQGEEEKWNYHKYEKYEKRKKSDEM